MSSSCSPGGTCFEARNIDPLWEALCGKSSLLGHTDLHLNLPLLSHAVLLKSLNLPELQFHVENEEHNAFHIGIVMRPVVRMREKV